MSLADAHTSNRVQPSKNMYFLIFETRGAGMPYWRNSRYIGYGIISIAGCRLKITPVYCIEAVPQYEEKKQQIQEDGWEKQKGYYKW